MASPPRAREPLRQAVVVASEGNRVRFTLFLSQAGKSAQLASAAIDVEAARVVRAELERILARHPERK